MIKNLIFIVLFLVSGMLQAAEFTIKITDGKGVIGLIAVSPLSQGKGYGQILNDACCNELSQLNIKILEVATQMDNAGACRFYEKCGFSVQSVTNIYHFWLLDEF